MATGRHGLYGTSIYVLWQSMRRRCEYPSNGAYPYYGGRGIRVCQRWRDDILNFISDMGQKPSPNHTIERINNDGNYEPSNCRWATRSEQARNRRSTRFFTHRGRTQTLSEWAKELGITHCSLSSRIKLAGWPEAMNTGRANRFRSKGK